MEVDHIISGLGYSFGRLQTFLRDILINEALTPEAERLRVECVCQLNEITGILNSPDVRIHITEHHSQLLNIGLSKSSGSLDEIDNETETYDNGIPRSSSSPDMRQDFPGNMRPSKTDSQSKDQRRSKPSMDYDRDFSFRELIIYDPIIEEDEEDLDDDEEDAKVTMRPKPPEGAALNRSYGRETSALKRKRKRDSAVLFDIALKDLFDMAEPDIAGYLVEKHTEKEWFCVLVAQHFCVFPTYEPEEMAFDVMMMPCCQITLDDRFARTPVFRLSQSGALPWVFDAGNERNLREWVAALSTAAGVNDPPPDKNRHRQRKVETKTEQNSNGLEHEKIENGFGNDNLKMGSEKNRETKSSERKASEPKPVKNGTTLSLTSLDEDEDLYISIEGEFEDYEDDGFATDEFESGSSEENETSSPVTSPSADKKPSKKKRRIFKWLKKNKKKEKGSQQGSIAIAGYIHRIEPSGSSKRWCVVQEGKLLCYKAIKDDNPEVTFTLQDCEVRSAEEDTRKQFSFHIIQDGSILLTLMAKNNKDMERWSSTIKAGCKSTSPTVESSGIYSQEDGDTYVTPSAPKGLIRGDAGVNSAPNSEQTSPSEGYVHFLSGKSDDMGEEENYLEPLPLRSQERTPSLTSPGYNKPLPELPVEEDSKVVTPNGAMNGMDMTEAEYLMSQPFEESIYEEVPAFNGNADKVTQYFTEKNEEGESKNGEKGKGLQPLGLEKGKIKDRSLSASSFIDMESKADQCRLNKQAQGSKNGCWMPQYNEKSQYFQVDFGDIKPVVGIATQGRPNYNMNGGMYVKSYTIAHSKNAEQWSTYKEFGITKVLNGNTDGETVVLNTFKSVVNARYVRIKPNAWHNHIALRAEFFTGEIEKPKPKKIIKALKRTLSNGKDYEKKEEEPMKLENIPVEKEQMPEEVFEELVAVEPVIIEPEIEKPPLMKLEVDTTDVVRRRKKELLSPEDQERHRLNRQSRELLRKLEVVTRVKKDIESEDEDEHEHDLSKSRECLNTREIVRERLKEIKNARDKEKEEEKKVPERKPSFKKSDDDVVERKVRLPQHDLETYDPERERELLEETEKAFMEYAKHKSETPRKLPLERKTSWESKHVIEEKPRVREKKQEVMSPEEESPRQSRIVKKSHEIKEEKALLLAKIEKLKRNVSEAKDKKIFFSLGNSNSGAAIRAEADYHEAQLELSKAKQRLTVIEHELKNLALFDLMNQKSPDISRPTSPEPLEGKKGMSHEKRVPVESPDVHPEEFNKGGTHAQKGSVMSLLKGVLVWNLSHELGSVHEKYDVPIDKRSGVEYAAFEQLSDKK